MGDKAFLNAINNNQNVTTVQLGADVPLPVVVHDEKIEAFPGGFAFVIKHHGMYQYFFKIEGKPAQDEPVVLALTRNGNILPNTLSTTGGSGLVHLDKGDSVTVRLAPDSRSGSIDLDSASLGGANNATLTLILLD